MQIGQKNLVICSNTDMEAAMAKRKTTAKKRIEAESIKIIRANAANIRRSLKRIETGGKRDKISKIIRANASNIRKALKRIEKARA
jgi:hypothetical protein